MPDRAGRVALVTGATGGLGPAVVEAFLAAGSTVVAVGRRPPAAGQARLVSLAADLTDGQAARDLAATVITRYGRIDALAHVMGGFAGGRPIAETDDATWDRMLDLNARAAFHIFRAVIPHMRAAGYGRIVAVAARAAVEPAANIAAYAASKAALVALVRAAALENKDRHITVNAVLPGTIDTPDNRAAMPKADTGRWVQPEALADVILFLASGAARALHGAAIPVYGTG